ncbi:MAG: DUF2441 domain-containing protein [Hyphomicrobium sp.]
MPEQVTDHILFHVTATNSYKQALVEHQSVITGRSHNPYFGFYEGSRTYPVTHNGAVAEVPAIAFLKKVRDGQINAPQLGAIAVEVAQHYVMLARELIMEQIRLAEFPDAPSRQTCLFACETLQEARYWRTRIGELNSSVCSLRVEGWIHRCDARLLLADSEPLSVTMDQARQYWRGERGANAEIETLFAGQAVVTAVGL